eukprot:CAMPEP_0197492318 /NCGR_PEP_ID=MMETSP1311-20131121/7899_1 /TAXON_ID=464262 /ORGANISM="Genus nov. species nov., Strain RCC856" /LENGTH=35 /DNA_ID= /DNA_START= /DNA_END= /DNA_ORIENTATION=
MRRRDVLFLTLRHDLARVGKPQSHHAGVRLAGVVP